MRVSVPLSLSARADKRSFSLLVSRDESHNEATGIARANFPQFLKKEAPAGPLARRHLLKLTLNLASRKARGAPTKGGEKEKSKIE